MISLNQNPRVGVVLVTYNSASQLLPLFQSLGNQSHSNIHVYLIDNASSDESVSNAESFYPEIKTRVLGKNEGFARASNIGAKLATDDGCDLVFILNNDVELDKDCIKELVNLIQSDQDLACVGPLIFKGRMAHDEMTIQEYGGEIDFLKYAIRKNYVNQRYNEDSNIPEWMYVDFVMGGALLIKVEIINKIGLFDERYFMYGDEIDLLFRVKKLDLKIAVTQRARLWHSHYSSSDNLERYYFERYYIVRNKYLYFLKHKFYKGLVISLLRDVFLSPLFYKGRIKKGEPKVLYYHSKGILDGLRNIKGKNDNIYP